MNTRHLARKKKERTFRSDKHHTRRVVHPSILIIAYFWAVYLGYANGFSLAQQAKTKKEQRSFALRPLFSAHLSSSFYNLPLLQEYHLIYQIIRT